MSTPRAEFRDDRRRLLRGGLWNAAGWVTALLTGPPVTIALVRSMTHSEFGLLAVGGALIGPTSAIAALGLGPAITQIASTEAVTFGNAGLAAALHAGLRVARRALPWVLLGCGCLIGLVEAVHGLRPTVFVVLALLPVVTVAPLASAFDGFLRATGSARWIGIATTVTSILGASAMVIVIVIGDPSAVAVAIVRSGGAIIACLILASAVARWRAAYRRSGDCSDDTREISLARFASFSGAMLLTGLSWLLISQFDVLFLGTDRGKVAAGIYAPASRVADIGITIAGIVGTMLLPALTTALQSGQHVKAVHLYHWASRWALVATAPLMAVMIVVPESALRLLYGAGFVGVAHAMRVLGLAVLLQVGFGFNGFMLEAHGVPQLAAVRSATGIFVTAGLCAILIPQFGFTGAAVATAGAIGVVNIFSSSALLRRYRVAPWDLPFVLALFGFALSLLFSCLISKQLDGDIARCALTGGVALAAAGLLPLARLDRRSR